MSIAFETIVLLRFEIENNNRKNVLTKRIAKWYKNFVTILTLEYDRYVKFETWIEI